jgi:hypothetical protein
MAQKRGRKTKSNKELDERYEFTATLLGLGLTKGVVKKRLIEAYRISPRQVENYITRARTLLVEWSGQSKEEHYVEALGFYRSVIQGAGGIKDKLQARERLDTLLDLEPPKKHQVSGLEDVLRGLPPEFGRRVREILGAPVPGANGEVSGNGAAPR